MKRIFKLWRIQGGNTFLKNFILIFSLTLIPILCVGIITFAYYNETISEQYIESSKREVEYKKEQFELIKHEADRIALRIASDHTFDDFYNGKILESELVENFEKRIVISTNLSGMLLYGDYINEIQIYNKNYDYVITSKQEMGKLYKVNNTMWFDKYIGMPSNISSITAVFDYQIFNQTGNKCISVIQKGPIYSSDMNSAIIVNIDFNILKSSLEENSDGKNILVIDADGTIVYSSDENNWAYSKYENNKGDMIKSGVFSVYQDDDVIITQTYSNYNGWQYIMVDEIDNLKKVKHNSMQFLFASILINILISIVFAWIISIHTYKPLKSILKYLQISNYTSSEIYDVDEVNYIIDVLEEKNVKNRSVMDEQLDNLNKSRMEALQYQINPHFLYNTLETINWKALRLCGRDNPVSEMILLLSDLVRNSLDSVNNIISIEKEIAYTKNYVELMKLRYKKINVTWEYEDRILNYKTIKMSLQPIIENAIYHGIKPKKGEGNIFVKISETEKEIVFDIIDDGIGVSPERANEINDNNYKGNEHVGVINVRRRIKILFGDEYDVKLYPLDDGAKTQINIPKIMDE